MKRFSFVLVVFSAFMLFLPADVFACACCAESGEYIIRTAKPTEYELELLSEMKFNEAAELFMTAGENDYLKGLKSIQKDFESANYAEDFFSLTNIFAAKTWKFNFKIKTGKTGTLVLPLPVQMLSFKADIHDGKQGGGGGPLLYKEWRFKGNVQTGNGFFRSSIIYPTTYFLVLQGRGNNCDNAEDFTNWRLEITGKNAGYAFFGKMGRSEAD